MIKRQIRFVSRAQQSFVTYKPKDDWAELLFCGGYGSGKSFSLGLWVLKYLSYPETDIVIARKNAVDIRKSTWKALTEPWKTPDGKRHPPLLPQQAIKGDDQVKGVITLWNKSTITLTGLADDQKIRSKNYHAGIVEEASELDYPMYKGFTPRIRNIHPLGNIVACASNPTPKTEWMYKHFVLGASPGEVAYFLSPTTDNIENLPKSYIRRLERLPEKEREMYLHGRFVTTGNLVFYCLSGNTVCELPFEPEGFVIGQDFGGGAKMSAAVLIAYTFAYGLPRMHIMEEFTKYKTRHKEMMDWMTERYDKCSGVCVYDGANAALKNDMEDADWMCYKGIKDLTGSFAVINRLLSEGRLTIDPRCVVVRSQVEGAEYVNETETVKKEAGWDAIDAVRYGVCHIEEEGANMFEGFYKGDTYVETSDEGDSSGEETAEANTPAKKAVRKETRQPESDGDDDPFFL